MKHYPLDPDLMDVKNIRRALQNLQGGYLGLWRDDGGLCVTNNGQRTVCRSHGDERYQTAQRVLEPMHCVPGIQGVRTCDRQRRIPGNLEGSHSLQSHPDGDEGLRDLSQVATSNYQVRGPPS